MRNNYSLLILLTGPMGSCKCSKLCQRIDVAKKVTMRRDEMRRTTLGVIRAPLRVHCVVTHLLLAHAAILYVTRLSNKTAINRTVHAAHAHISFDYTLLLRLWTPDLTNGTSVPLALILWTSL